MPEYIYMSYNKTYLVLLSESDLCLMREDLLFVPARGEASGLAGNEGTFRRERAVCFPRSVLRGDRICGLAMVPPLDWLLLVATSLRMGKSISWESSCCVFRMKAS